MIIVGKKFVSEGLFEVEVRKTGEKMFVNFDELIKLISFKK